MPPLDSVFRPFRPSDAERSDRAAGDRSRHREKVRQAIRENIAAWKRLSLQVKPFLKQYCERCHNGEKRTSGVRVDHLDPAQGEEFSKLGLEDDRHRGAIAKALGDAGR